MRLLKNPPKQTIYEALSVIGDGRVKLVSNRQAEVLYLDRTRNYLVEWSEGVCAITSNNDASYWQGHR
jgi:hypothetical protein